MKKTKKQKSKTADVEFTVSSGNVFADFGFKDSEKEEAKSNVAILVTKTIKERGITQQQAADMMGIDQPKVSKITRGLLSEFSIESLMDMLVRLGYDIKIEATLHKKKNSEPAFYFISHTKLPSAHVRAH